MEKDNKVIIAALLILFVSMLSFNYLDAITGEAIKKAPTKSEIGIGSTGISAAGGGQQVPIPTNQQTPNSQTNSVSSTTNQIDIVSNLRLYLNFDDAKDGDVEVKDYSGKGNNGHLELIPKVRNLNGIKVNDGKFGKGLDSRSPGIISFIDDGHIFDVFSKETYTLSYWIKFEYDRENIWNIICNNEIRYSEYDHGNIFAPEHCSSGSEGIFNKIIFKSLIGTTNSYSVDISKGEWNLITYTYDGNNLKTYINGEKKKEINVGSNFKLHNRFFSIVGKREGYIIDEVMIYDRDLNEDEINTLKNLQAPTKSNLPEDDILYLNSERISVDAPTTMAVGQNTIVKLKFRNRGSIDWTYDNVGLIYYHSNSLPSFEPEFSKLGNSFEQKLDRLSQSEVIKPLNDKEFAFNINAPQTPGIYYLNFRLVSINKLRTSNDLDKSSFGDDIKVIINVEPINVEPKVAPTKTQSGIPILNKIPEYLPSWLPGSKLPTDLGSSPAEAALKESLKPTLDCDSFRGYACDSLDYSKPLEIQFEEVLSFGRKKQISSTIADITREKGVQNLCGGNSDHGFEIKTPDSLKDGKTHKINVYKLNLQDENGSTKTLIGTSNIQCSKSSETDLMLYLTFDDANDGDVEVKDYSGKDNNGHLELIPKVRNLNGIKVNDGKFGKGLDSRSPGIISFIDDGHIFDVFSKETYTLSYWIKFEYDRENIWNIICNNEIRYSEYDHGNIFAPEHCSSGSEGIFNKIIFKSLIGTTNSYSVDISKGEWNLITYTYDGNNLKTYINGEKKKEINVGSNFKLHNRFFSIVGKREGYVIDEVRVYDRDLNEEEIRSLAGLQPKADIPSDDLVAAGGQIYKNKQICKIQIANSLLYSVSLNPDGICMGAELPPNLYVPPAFVDGSTRPIPNLKPEGFLDQTNQILTCSIPCDVPVKITCLRDIGVTTGGASYEENLVDRSKCGQTQTAQPLVSRLVSRLKNIIGVEPEVGVPIGNNQQTNIQLPSTEIIPTEQINQQDQILNIPQDIQEPQIQQPIVEPTVTSPITQEQPTAESTTEQPLNLPSINKETPEATIQKTKQTISQIPSTQETQKEITKEIQQPIKESKTTEIKNQFTNYNSCAESCVKEKVRSNCYKILWWDLCTSSYKVKVTDEQCVQLCKQAFS